MWKSLRKTSVEFRDAIATELRPLFAKRTRGAWILVGVGTLVYISDKFDSLVSLAGKVSRMGTTFKWMIDVVQYPAVAVALIVAGLIWVGIACYFAGPRELQDLQQQAVSNFDPNNAFEIDALAVPNLQNKTEQSQDIQGKAAWSRDCEISIRNLHPTQGFDDVTLRIVNMTPPMTASPSHHPRTQDTTLRQVKFSFTDIPPGKPLPGDTTGHVRIFNASRGPMIGGIRKVIICFFGTWPTNLGTEFAANAEHRLTVEVTGSGVGRKEAQFTLAFSQETDKPVFNIQKVAPPCERATKCAQDTALLLNNSNYACSFHAFWRSGAGDLPSNESILEACFLLVKNRHEHPFADLDEYVPGKDYYAFFDFLKHDASNAGVYPAAGIAYLEAAERWRVKQGYPEPSSMSRLKMTLKPHVKVKQP